MDTTGTFIMNNEGNLVEVTDFTKASEEAKMFVGWHEGAKREKQNNPDIFYCKDAHDYWADILFKLEKLGRQNPKLLNQLRQEAAV